MSETRQAILGVLAAIISAAIILGSLAVSLVEGGARFAIAPTLTSTSAVIPTQLPGEPTFTPRPTPPPTATQVVPTPSNCNVPPGWISITIQPDDTLQSLAIAYGTTVAELQAGNCLIINTINSGTILVRSTLAANRHAGAADRYTHSYRDQRSPHSGEDFLHSSLWVAAVSGATERYPVRAGVNFRCFRQHPSRCKLYGQLNSAESLVLYIRAPFAPYSYPISQPHSQTFIHSHFAGSEQHPAADGASCPDCNTSTAYRARTDEYPSSHRHHPGATNRHSHTATHLYNRTCNSAHTPTPVTPAIFTPTL